MSVVAEAANAALEAAASYLHDRGATVDMMFVVLTANGTPDGDDAVTCARGIDDPRQLVAFLLTQATAAAKQIGMRVDLVPVRQRGEG